MANKEDIISDMGFRIKYNIYELLEEWYSELHSDRVHIKEFDTNKEELVAICYDEKEDVEFEVKYKIKLQLEPI